MAARRVMLEDGRNEGFDRNTWIEIYEGPNALVFLYQKTMNDEQCIGLTLDVVRRLAEESGALKEVVK